MSLKTRRCFFITLPKVNTRHKGMLWFGEANRHIPFPIARFFYISHVSPGNTRGNHANKKSDQVLFCLRGRVKIHLDDGNNQEDILLTKPDRGIYIRHMVWNTMSDFSPDTLLLVLASDTYSKRDYIRSYKDFLRIKTGHHDSV